MEAKTEQLQIRLTPGQKARLKRLARAAGMDVSAYVLARALPRVGDRLAGIVRALVTGDDHRYPLAELNDLLTATVPAEFAEVSGGAASELRRLEPLLQNYVAAMVEQACHLRGIEPPGWTGDIAPLRRPYFAVPLRSLRSHLLRAAPVAFRRRNIFVDSSVGDRV